MNLVELDTALRKLRLSGMAASLDARLRQAQSERQTPIDLVSALVADELVRRQDRLIARRIQQARFRDLDRTLDSFDLDFNKKMEFPGFGGDFVTAVSGPLRTALGSRRLGDCAGGYDCRSDRCSRPPRSTPALGSCRSAS